MNAATARRSWEQALAPAPQHCIRGRPQGPM